MTKAKEIHLRLNEVLLEQIDFQAKRLKMNRTEFITWLCKKYCNGREDKSEVLEDEIERKLRRIEERQLKCYDKLSAKLNYLLKEVDEYEEEVEQSKGNIFQN